MDRRERMGDIEEAVRIALDGMQSQLWTALPGIIQSVDLTRMVAVVQPSIMAKWQPPGPNGTLVDVALPLLVDVPIVFPSGGGFTLTFPLAAGDEGLVVFSSRCIDAWWQSGGVQPQIELRMHDLSDGFLFVGARSQVRLLPNVSAENTQLRSDDGNTFVEITPGVDVNVTAVNAINLTAPTVTITAASLVTMDTPEVQVTGSMIVRGHLTSTADTTPVDATTHVHSNTQPGLGQSGPPVPGAPP